MTSGLFAPAIQVCAFALGCALIHAARAHAAIVTQWLICIAAAIGALAVTAATVAWTPDDRQSFDEITVYAAYAGHPQGAE